MSIVDRARAWIADDPDADTRRELESLIRADDRDALEERFSGGLQFGTAGLRGLLGAGPTRMNRVTVSRATAGLCAWLKKQVPEAASRGICVGRDARDKSDVFEREVIEVATGAGVRVHVFTTVVPTPVLAFSVLEAGAAGGVMITASHNPPGYNGYKVYWENGAQIIPPHDEGIAGEIESSPPFGELPRMSAEDARHRGLLREVDFLRDTYVERIVSELGISDERAPVRVAYTALHGVAEKTFRSAAARAGLRDVQSVAEQSEPDAAFPTVSFPNPEEPGAMDLVLSLGQRIGADIAVANDPDGDRVGIAAGRSGAFEVLSGNDIGALLTDELLRRHGDAPRPVVLSTIVSSPILGPICEKHDARWEQTLTGHKWIQNRALELEREGLTPVFGYEEALGYAPCRAVRDKDGISAALLIIDMAAALKAQGRSLLDARDELWREHGYYADCQVSLRFEGPGASERMNAVVDGLRSKPPRQIGGQTVSRMLDFGRQRQWSPVGEAPFEDHAPSNLLIFELEGGHRAMVRPSGTEPKLKYYFYAKARRHAREDLGAAKKEAHAVLERMVNDLTRPNGC